MTSAPQLIAIVDDDPSIRKAVSSLLRSEGYAVASFEGAAAFLNDAALHEASCLLTDVQMPQIDGIALQLEARRFRPGLPVIFMTAYQDAATREKAFAGGASAFLGKPFAAEALLYEIDLALQQRTG